MKSAVELCLGLVIGVIACTNSWAANSVGTDGGKDIPPGTRTVHAARVENPPKVDGRLDDKCWQEARAITAFSILNTDRLAANQTFSYVSYDEMYLYIGMKCLMPEGVKPVGEPQTDNDASIWNDDAVEIMLDPGFTRTNYYQLAMNAYGARFDCSRREGGAVEDSSWNGDWEGRTHIADGYWSAELAVPYHTLGITPQTGSIWGINLCRDAPFELSSIALNGAFNAADKFAVLKGMDADFRKHAFDIGPYVTELSIGDHTKMKVGIQVKNGTSKERTVKLGRHVAGGASREEIVSRVVTLKPDEPFVLPMETLNVEASRDEGNKIFYLSGTPQTSKVVVMDAESGGILSSSPVTKPAVHEAMGLIVKNEWYSGMTGEETRAVSMKVTLGLTEDQRKSGTLEVEVVSLENGEAVAGQKISGPEKTTSLSFPIERGRWGAYEARAVFKDRSGRGVLSTRSPAMVIPGGKQHVKVLNNFVSELMNAKERGLLGEREIAFMNPRDGWCYFFVSGDVQVKLDEIEAPILPVKAWGDQTEVMRYLKAGRHTLKVIMEGNGELGQLIVRGIPALQYYVYGAGPHVKEYGPYDWDFLAEHVLPNVNVMLGYDKPVEEHIKMWKGIGRSWIGYASSYRDPLDPSAADAVEKVYANWSESIGYRHPLMDGAIIDEFHSTNDPVYDIYRMAVDKLNADFKDRSVLLYAGGDPTQQDKSRRLVFAAISAGGYLCPEYYLVEQFSAKAAGEYIDTFPVQDISRREGEVPGINQRTVAVLGYMTTPPEMLNVYPTTDFKVYMDMQMRALATAPGCFGLGGLQWYNCTTVDEENLRWASRLLRHYCIEGRTGPATQDPYMLTHIMNPDFLEGTRGWDIQAAADGRVWTGSHVGYGYLQSRYMYRADVGDTFLVTKRSANKPNVFGQEVRGMEPGRLYSMKMITCDYQDLLREVSSRKEHGVSIKIDNAEILPGAKNSFEHDMQGGFHYGLGRFKRAYPCWMKYHWRVFRAKGETARLSISDWKNEKEPGGPAGQEVMYNFIEIQPYFAEGSFQKTP